MQPDAPTEIIKASYRTMMQKLGAHPDLGGDEWNATVINEAYRVLSNDSLRRHYDRQGKGDHAPASPTKRRTRSGSGSGKSSHSTSKSGPRRTICAFCGSEHLSGVSVSKDGRRCRNCDSPLTRAAMRTRGANERRAVKRVSLNDNVTFCTHWPQRDPFRGQVVNLSPMGMQFIASQPVQPNQRLKLEGFGLSAVARVARCTPRFCFDPQNHLIGVEFITLSIKCKRSDQ